MSERRLASVALLVLVACRKDAAKLVDASPPPPARVVIVDPEEEKSTLSGARVDEVRLAYEHLLAGRADDARAALKKLGSPRPVEAKELLPHVIVSETGRVLLESIRPCERVESDADTCEAKREHTRNGTCKDATLSSVCITTVVDVDTGTTVGAYAPYEIGTRGKWLVRLLAPANATVLDRDLKVLGSAVAYDFLPLDDTHLLFIDRPPLRPDADDTRSVRTIDLATQESSKGCSISVKQFTSQPISSAGLAANGATLVFQASRRNGGNVWLCDVASGKILGNWAPQGDRAWALDADGKTLYVSGIVINRPTVGHPSNDYEPVVEVEHLAINAASGEVLGRARTEERSRSSRSVAFVPQGNLLVITHGRELTMLAAKPLRSPPGPPAKAGYAYGGPMALAESDVASAIRVLPNGTFLVDYGIVLPGMTNHAATAWKRARREVRLYSAKTRAVLWEGVLATIFEDKTQKRAGWISIPKPAADPNVVVVDANGVVTTRALPPDFDAGFPPELAGLIDTGGPSVTEIAEKLAPNLCAIGGLYVPRKLCSFEQR